MPCLCCSEFATYAFLLTAALLALPLFRLGCGRGVCKHSVTTARARCFHHWRCQCWQECAVRLALLLHKICYAWILVTLIVRLRRQLCIYTASPCALAALVVAVKLPNNGPLAHVGAFVRRMMKEMSRVGSRHFDFQAARMHGMLPVESAMPGTTLGLVRLAAFTSGGALFDTPGVPFTCASSISRMSLSSSGAFPYPCRGIRCKTERLELLWESRPRVLQLVSHLWQPALRIAVTPTCLPAQIPSCCSGLHFHHRMPHILSPQELKAIHPKRKLRPYLAASPFLVAEENDCIDPATERVRPCATYHWGALMRIDVLTAPADAQIVFFGTGVVQVFACALMAEDEFVELDHSAKQEDLEQAHEVMFGAQSVANHGGLRVAREVDLEMKQAGVVVGDIAMSGLPGWVSIVSGRIRGPLQLRVWTPRGVEAFLRPPLPCPCPVSITKMSAF
jgi:hypothetical protein